MRLSGIVEESIVDGPGLRYVLFTQGCPHHCKGCHNPQTHDFEGGFPFTAEAALAQIGENPLLAGVTLSGGEPFEQAQALCAVAEGVQAQTHQALKNLKAVLQEAGLTLDNVVKTTVFVQDLGDFGTVNEIYGTYFHGGFPARSCVQIAALPKGALVEIECIAVR